MPTQPVHRNPPSFERDLLAQLSSRWGKRVAVKKDELDLDGHFDPELPDFPDQLVPMLNLPAASSLDPERRQRIVSAAWIAYNAKTAAIENEIILPACRLMLEERIPMRRDEVAVSALHQTIIDEHYHILMCHNAVGVTRRRRELTDLTFDPDGWSVVHGLKACRADLTGSERDLVEIAFALAAETTIASFLSVISTAFDIQPMNRITVDMHRKDENGHAVVFRELVAPLYRDLGHGDRELFKDALVQGLTAFRAPDFDPWVTVAEAGEFDISTEQLAAAASGTTIPTRDTGSLQLLLADLGVDSKFAETVASAGSKPDNVRVIV
ncbi:MAG: diiron oxygenase [Pseudonocardiales bacterium]|nr:diiron oxygenase [Pseudonocardiales bacterium]